MADAPDANGYPQLPVEADERSWLARNRRFVILLVTAVVLVGGAVVWSKLRSPSPSTSNTTNTIVTNSATGTNSSTGTYRRYTVTAPPDQDHDGLSDAEEEQLGTNPVQSDTDGDRLPDYDEVKIYHSDPRKPDTDGDGIVDGTEVRQGTNPAGSGPILNTNSALHSPTK